MLNFIFFLLFALKKPLGGSDGSDNDGGRGGGGGWDLVGKKSMLLAPFLTPAETKNIVVTIHIGQEICCLPYVGL